MKADQIASNGEFTFYFDEEMLGLFYLIPITDEVEMIEVQGMVSTDLYAD